MDDFGLDIEEVTKVIESADVLVVRFAIVDKRLLIDTRTNGPGRPVHRRRAEGRRQSKSGSRA